MVGLLTLSTFLKNLVVKKRKLGMPPGRLMKGSDITGRSRRLAIPKVINKQHPPLPLPKHGWKKLDVGSMQLLVLCNANQLI